MYNMCDPYMGVCYVSNAYSCFLSRDPFLLGVGYPCQLDVVMTTSGIYVRNVMRDMHDNRRTMEPSCKRYTWQ